MIEIDLAPAPTSSAAASSTLPAGAADDFAAALHDAGGREPGPRGDRTPDAPRDAEAPTRDTVRSEPDADDAVSSEPSVDTPVDGEVAETEPEESIASTSAPVSPSGPTLPIDVTATPAGAAATAPAQTPVADVVASTTAVADESSEAELAAGPVEGAATLPAPDASADGTPQTTEIVPPRSEWVNDNGKF